MAEPTVGDIIAEYLPDFAQENMQKIIEAHDAYMREDSATVQALLTDMAGSGVGYGARACMCTGIILGFSIAKNIRELRGEYP